MGSNKRKLSLYCRQINKIDRKIGTVGLALGLTHDICLWSLQELLLT